MLSSRKLQFFSIMSAVFIGLALFNFARSSAASGPSTITVTVVSDGLDSFNFGGFSLANGESHVISPYATGLEQIYQTELSGYNLSIECTGATYSLFGTNGVGVDYVDGAEVVCTFTNALVAGSFTVINQTDGEDTFEFQHIGGITYTLAHNEEFTVGGLNPGSYDVYQALQPGYELGISCEGGATEALGSNGIRMNVGEQEDIVCTFNNQNVAGSFTVQVASDTDAEFTFGYDGETHVLGAGDSFSKTNLNPGNFDVFQTEMPGYTLNISCEGGATEAQGSNGIRMMVGQQEDIVCTFDNDYVGSTVTLNNVINPSASMTVDYVGQFGEFALADGGSQTTTDVMPGTYTYYVNTPAGYVIDLSCNEGTNAVASGDNGLELTITPEQDIVCTSELTYVAGSVTINTVVNGTDIALEYATSFENFSQANGASRTFSESMPGVYFIYQNAAEDYNITSISCEGADSALLGTNGIEVTLDAREDAVCTFVSEEVIVEPTAPTNLLVNADFEAGRDGTWREQSDYGFELVVHESAYGGTVPPQSGEYLAWLGGARWEDSYISQQVELPAGESAVVSFSYWIESRDWCGYDWGAIYVYDIEANNFSRVWAHTLCRGTETNGWADAEVDLTDYAGKTIRVVFYGGNDNVYRSSMYVDDVAVMSIAPTGRSASTELEIVSADPKDLGAGEAEEVIDGDLDSVTETVEKPARDENSRALADDLITNKAPAETTAVALSSANAAGNSSTSILMVTMLTMALSGATAIFATRRRNVLED